MFLETNRNPLEVVDEVEAYLRQSAGGGTAFSRPPKVKRPRPEVVERVPDHGMTPASLVVHFILTVITLGGGVFVWILYQLLARLTAKGVRVEAVEGDSSAGVRIYGPKDLVAEMATFVRRYDRGLANLSTSERGWEM